MSTIYIVVGLDWDFTDIYRAFKTTAAAEAWIESNGKIRKWHNGTSSVVHKDHEYLELRVEVLELED